MTGKADPDVMRRLKENYAPFYAATKPGLLTERFYRDNCYYYRAEVLPLLPENRNARILEVGCGAGHLIRFLAERGYGRVGGVELDRGLCEMARNNVGDKAEFIEHGDALAFLASRRDRFDAVIALDVIEHFALAEAASFSRSVCASLTAEGVFILRTPNLANLLGPFVRYDDLTHQAGYTEDSLRQLLLCAGFQTASAVKPRYSWPHLQTFRLLLTAALHRLLFALEGFQPCVSYDPNLVMCARKSEPVGPR